MCPAWPEWIREGLERTAEWFRERRDELLSQITTDVNRLGVKPPEQRVWARLQNSTRRQSLLLRNFCNGQMIND